MIETHPDQSREWDSAAADNAADGNGEPRALARYSDIACRTRAYAGAEQRRGIRYCSTLRAIATDADSQERRHSELAHTFSRILL